MAEEAQPATLQGKAILVVEDNYLLATELELFLQDQGAVVLGPVGSVQEGLAVVARDGSRIDAAVLDINVRNERAFAVADALAARHVPVVFCTGYDHLLLGQPYVSAPSVGKPIDYDRLARLLSAAVAGSCRGG